MVLKFDRTAFEAEALLAAGYRFTDRFSVSIPPAEDDRSILVCLQPVSDDDSIMPDDLATAFTNEALDQQLRISLERRFGHVRDIISEFAFSPLDAKLAAKKKA